MWLYTENENTWLRNSRTPLNHSVDESWPTPAQIEYHRRNAEIIRAQAIGEATRMTIAFVRSSWRKLRGLSAKNPSHSVKPGATA
jgi:hypothetical protein